MAQILGSFSGVSSSNIRPYIEYSYTQNQAGNYSDITYTLYYQRLNGAYYGYNYQSNEADTNIDGDITYNYDADFDLTGGNYLYAVVSRTKRVYHNTDGTRTVYMSAFGETNVGWGSYNLGQTITLPTIPREAYVNNTIDFTIGDNIPLTIINAGNFYLKAKLYVNNVLIKTVSIGQATSYTFTTNSSENTAMYAQTPNSVSVTAFMRIETYSDSGYVTRVGVDKDKACTTNVNQTTSKPTFTTYSVANVDKSVVVQDKYSNTLITSSTHTLVGSVTNKLISGVSKARATVTAANKAVAQNSATMSKYKLIADGQNAEAAYSAVADITVDINNVTTKDFTLQAIDSRNLITSVNASLDNLANYFNVSLFGLTLTRANNVDAIVGMAFNGLFFKEYFGGGSSGVLNTITAHYRYKETTVAWGSQTWNSITPTSDSSGNISFSANINGDLGASGFNTDKAYDVEVRIYDKLSQTIISGVINRGIPLLDYTKDGVAVKGKYNSGVGGVLQLNGSLALSGTLVTPTASEINSILTGWYAAGETWTYSSADGSLGVYTISDDKTTKYYVGMRVRYVQSLTTKYGIIVSVSYSAPNTTIKIWGGASYTLANAAISSPCWSFEDVPLGFPITNEWDLSTYGSAASQTGSTGGAWVNLGSISLAIQIGQWEYGYKASGFMDRAANAAGSIYTTLSTGNNTESNTHFTVRDVGYAYIPIAVSIRDKVTLSTKTTHYLNWKTDETVATYGIRMSDYCGIFAKFLLV